MSLKDYFKNDNNVIILLLIFIASILLTWYIDWRYTKLHSKPWSIFFRYHGHLGSIKNN